MEEIQVGDLTINPSLKKTIKDIHPAIGVVDDTAYVGVWLPCEITGKKGEVAYKDLLFLVTDKHKLILANDEVFRKKNLDWRLAYKPIKFANRWCLRDVQAYLDGATVDLGVVLDGLGGAWKKYMELPSEREYLYHTLWDIGTYFHHLFNCFPYHYVGGVKRSGKTKDLMMHYCLAFNAIFSHNMSTPSIYRLIQNARTTLLIDETEKLSYKGQMSERTLEFRSVLLSGYKKGGKAYRTEKTRKEMFQPQAFEVYSPKALANIRGLEDVMEERCKSTILKRSTNAKIVNLEINENDEEWTNLRNQLYILFLTYWKEIKQIYDRMKDSSELSEVVNISGNTPFSQEDLDLLVGRELELWKPMFTLTLFLEQKSVSTSKFTGSLSSLILRLAIDDAKQRQIENVTETGEVILLQVLTQVVDKDHYYSVKTLKEKMAEAYDEEQKWLTTRWIGNALRRLGFKEKRRVGTGYQYMLRKGDVDDLAERMGLPSKIVKTDEKKLSEIKKWIFEHEKGGTVSAPELAGFIKTQGFDPTNVVEKLTAQGVLLSVSELGRWGVVIPQENTQEEENPQFPPKATTCWICNKLLPEDLKNCTTEEGKPCHLECLRKLKAGRRPSEKNELSLFLSSLSPEKISFLKSVKRVRPLDPPEKGGCYVCEKKGNLPWQLEGAEESWTAVCEECAPKVMLMLNQAGRSAD